MANQICERSIGWHVINILKSNKNKAMQWREILKKVQRKKLKRPNSGWYFVINFNRNKETFEKEKRGWYRLK